MIKPAFSTLACPEWTIEQVATHALRYGFEAVELRTFGETASRLACDPALTSDEKTRRLFHDAGVEILSLGTSVSFHEPINPPVIGRVFGDTERSIRQGKRAVDLAVGLECPLVRVFGFEVPPREKRKAAVARIGERLAAVADHAEKTGVKIVIENAGSFSRAMDLVELIAAAQSPLVGACYSLASGVTAGDSVSEALDLLAGRLWVARIKDLDKNGRPCPLDQGTLPCRQFVGALATAGFDGPLIFEWDRLWIPGLAAADIALPLAGKQLFQWMHEFAGAGATGVMPRPAVTKR